MASTAQSTGSHAENVTEDGVSLVRLYVLRATYLFIVIGLGAMIVPEILSHELTSRGVIAALLGGVWVLAILGLRYPLELLPLLMFEFVWKAIWMLFYGLPQWSAGEYPATFPDDFLNIAVGVILVPLVMPWGYVWRRYVRRPAARWH